MNRNEVLVMEEMLKRNCLNQLQSLTINTLADDMDVSYYSIRNIIRSLVMGEYCGVGLKKGRSETYYLTEKGIEKIKEYKEVI